VHLVPFGEFLPFQDTLEDWGIRQLTRLPGGFSAGDRPRNITLPDGLTLAPMICYEAIFPDGTIDPDKRPDVILNVTNDAWFGMTPGPYQHLGQARVRAIEQGLPLIRAANTGISAMIDPWGRPVRKLDLGAEGVLDAALPLPLPPTLYSRGGWLMVLVGYVLLALGAWAATPRFDFVRRGNQGARPAGM
jgi:apolipoprotein N-acyltransferase